MRSWAAVSTFLLLAAACSEAPAQDAEPAKAPDEPADPPPTTSVSASDEDAAYAQMRQAAALFAQEQYADLRLIPEEDYLTGETLVVYDLINCQESIENVELGALDQREALLELLARRVSGHEHFLSQILDEGIYREPLDAYESDYRRLIADMPAPQPSQDPAWQPYLEWGELDARLAQAIEARRIERGVEGVTVRVDGGCGAGETPYSIATNPAGGTVWLTTKFSFDLCGVRGRDQWNIEDCRWTEIGSSGETHFLSGRYAYQARWPDGRSRRGVRKFDSLADFDPDDFEPVLVTIAAP